MDRRKKTLDDFNKLAHARSTLLVAVAHISKGAALIGHGFNDRSLWAMANEYAQQSVNACISIGIALNERLPNEGAWSVEQAKLLDDWNTHLASMPDPPPLPMAVDESRT